MVFRRIRYDFNSVLFAIVLKSEVSSVPEQAVVGQRPRNVQQAFTALFAQVLRGERTAEVVIRTDDGNSVVSVILIEGYDGQGNMFIALFVEDMRAGDEPVDVLLLQKFQVLRFLFVRIEGVAQNEAVVVLHALPLHAGDELAEKGVARIGHQYGNQIGRVALQGPRDLVGVIIELFHRIVYELARFFADIPAVVEHARYGSGGKICLPCNVFNGEH